MTELTAQQAAERLTAAMEELDASRAANNTAYEGLPDKKNWIMDNAYVLTDQRRVRARLNFEGLASDTETVRALLAERRELLARQSENAEIIAVHDKLQASRLGMHPLIAAMSQVAAGASMDEAMRDIGYAAKRKTPLSEQAARELAGRWYDADESGVELVRMTEKAHGICAAPASPTATD